VTSDGFFVGILFSAAWELKKYELFLLETESDLLLARVENNYCVKYVSRLIGYAEPIEVHGFEFRWAYETGVMDRNRKLRVNRCAPLAAKTEQDAVAIFKKLEPQEAQDMLGSKETLNRDKQDLENAKLKVMKDSHGQAIRALERWADTESVDEKLLDEAAKQFAIDVRARTGLILTPVERLTPLKRKSLARRCRKMKNKALRHLVQYWLKNGYNKRHAPDLSRILFEVTGRRISPSALTKARERLGLVTEVAGRPGGRRKS
jgi:hypothetical protein